MSAIVTTLALWYAIRATRYAAESVRIEQTPVLTLEHRAEDDTLALRNLGRGVALIAFVTDEDGKLVQAVSGIGPNESVRIESSGVEFSLSTGNFLYGQDIAGDWCAPSPSTGALVARNEVNLTTGSRVQFGSGRGRAVRSAS